MNFDDITRTSPGTLPSKTTVMLIPLRLSFLLPVFIKWICINQVAALAVQNSSISSSQLANVNANLTAVPPAFDIRRLPKRGPAFDKFDCFGLATNLLSGMARSDTSNPLPPHQWAAHGVRLELALTGARRGTRDVLTRYVIWGIYKAVGEMIQADDFGKSIFMLKWQGKFVGSLTFSPLVPVPLLSIPSNDTMSNITQDLSPPSLSNNTSPVLLVNPSLKMNSLAAPSFEIQVFGKSPYTSLDPSGVFMNMLGLLVAAADHPASETITSPFTVAVAEFDVQVAVTGPTDGKPITTPPLFLYNHLCIGLHELSESLLRTRHFGTFKVRILVDDTEIGWLFFGPTAGTTALTAEE